VNHDTFRFFQGHEAALPVYIGFEEWIRTEFPDVKIMVSKTQISFSNRRGFAYVSFLPVRKKKDRPEHYITVTFGLGERKISSRIDASTEPYPNRWTHHLMVTSLEEIDDELMEWIREAAAFSDNKR